MIMFSSLLPKNVRDRHILSCALVVIFGLLVYSNTYHVGFQPDDLVYIAKNPFVTRSGFSLETVKKYGELYKAVSQRYVGYLSFAADYRLHALALPGYHIVNNCLHILNALLVYLLVVLSFKTTFLNQAALKDRAIPLALATACMFAVHPLQTEAVTYIMQRLASLTASFYLASLLLYIKGRLLQEESSRDANRVSVRTIVYFVGSWISAILAMKTKENAFTLPVVIALYEAVFFKGQWRNRARILFPFVLTMLVIPVNTLWLLAKTGMTQEEFVGFARVTPAQHLLTQSTVVIDYIRLLLLPIGQNFDHDVAIRRSFADGAVIIAVILILLLLALAGYLLRMARKATGSERILFGLFPNLAENRLIAFGILWFFITLSLEAGAVPLPNAMCEYRTYLPSIGFFIALLSMLFVIIERFKGGRLSRLLLFTIFLWIVVLAAAAYQRNSVWADNITLWEDVVKKSPRKAKPHHNLGLNYMTAGRFREAEKEFLTSVLLDPNLLASHVNLGELYYQERRFDEAIREFQTVTALFHSSYYYNMLAMACDDAGRTSEAFSAFQKSLQTDPGNSDTHYHLGIAFARKKRFGEAVREFQTALEIDPRAATVWNVMGMAYDETGRLDEAKNAFRQALTINPEFPEAHNNLGIVLTKQRRYEDAIHEYQSALNIDADYGDARRNLGDAVNALNSRSAGTPRTQVRVGQ